MIKKLIERLNAQKEFNLIKKHFKIARRHKSFDELENVKFELLDFQGKLIEENKLSDNINFKIFSLLAEIDYTRLKLIQIDDNISGFYRK